jgi:hypothetical protein
MNHKAHHAEAEAMYAAWSDDRLRDFAETYAPAIAWRLRGRRSAAARDEIIAALAAWLAERAAADKRLEVQA